MGARKACTASFPRACGRSAISNVSTKEKGEVCMSSFTILSRIAVGAYGTLVIGAVALAQTSPPAPAPAPAAPATSPLGIPLTATLATPGYPPPGPADPALRVLQTPGGKKIHVLPATLETTQWGWFDNAQPPVLRVRSGDTIILETMMHSHNQV